MLGTVMGCRTSSAHGEWERLWVGREFGTEESYLEKILPLGQRLRLIFDLQFTLIHYAKIRISRIMTMPKTSDYRHYFLHMTGGRTRYNPRHSTYIQGIQITSTAVQSSINATSER